MPEAYELITRIAGKGVLTNLLQPYALTRMTDDGMPSQARKHMEPDAVAPALTALASEDCRLNGEYIVTGGGRLRRASVVEWDTVWLPNEPDLSPGQLEALLARSHLARLHDEHAVQRWSSRDWCSCTDGGPDPA